MPRRAATLFLSAALAAGCEQYETAISEIDDDLVVPQVVTAGVPITAEFTTFGSGCREPLYEEAEPRKSGFRITPYDKVRSGSCPLFLATHPRRVELVLEEPGVYVVELRGKAFASPSADEVTIERVVTAE